MGEFSGIFLGSETVGQSTVGYNFGNDLLSLLRSFFTGLDSTTGILLMLAVWHHQFFAKV